MSENITFRAQLIGSVSDFCDASNIAIVRIPLNLVEIIVALSKYQEEGVRLNPALYIFADIGSAISMLPEAERIKIGEASADLPGIKIALKKCAPLARDGWSIYIDSNIPLRLEYGLFRGSTNPLSIATDDIILQPESPPVVKAYGIVDNCVEIRSNNGSFHRVFFDHRKDNAGSPLNFLDRLTSKIVSNCLPELRDPAMSFLKKELFAAMRVSHGCLIAVISGKKPAAFLMSDGIILQPPIDFSKLVKSLLQSKSSEDAGELTSKSALIKGMLNSDGIVIFDTRARLLGYNCFVRVARDPTVIGGARRRAFGALQSKVGHGLTAAFMQSQDGATEFREASDEQ